MLNMKTKQLPGKLFMEYLIRSKNELNVSLARRIKKIYPDKFFSTEIQNRIEKGRKIRSLLFLAIARSLSQKIKEDVLLDVCLSI